MPPQRGKARWGRTRRPARAGSPGAARRILPALAALLACDACGLNAAGAQELARGAALYAAHCAACHGAELQGQPNWRQPFPDGTMPAPPLDATGHASHHADADLFATIKQGVAKRGMPAFGGVLSDAEVAAVIAYIQSHW
jgi:mono/diheme cytochrome c family protein